MTPTEIIESLKRQGIDLTAQGTHLRVLCSQGLTDEQKELITENKSRLLEHLSPTSAAVQDQPKFYTEYRLPSGEAVPLTREEFDNVVDLFRLLLRQDTWLRGGRKAA